MNATKERLRQNDRSRAELQTQLTSAQDQLQTVRIQREEVKSQLVDTRMRLQ